MYDSVKFSLQTCTCISTELYTVISLMNNNVPVIKIVIFIALS